VEDEAPPSRVSPAELSTRGGSGDGAGPCRGATDRGRWATAFRKPGAAVLPSATYDSNDHGEYREQASHVADLDASAYPRTPGRIQCVRHPRSAPEFPQGCDGLRNCDRPAGQCLAAPSACRSSNATDRKRSSVIPFRWSTASGWSVGSNSTIGRSGGGRRWTCVLRSAVSGYPGNELQSQPKYGPSWYRRKSSARATNSA